MARRFSFVEVFSLLLCVCCVRSDISLEKNVYKGIVVALSPHAQVEDPQTFFEALRDAFSGASRSVFDRLKNRAFFEEVTLLLPKGSKFVESLNVSGVSYTVSSRPSYESAHFVIENRGVFGGTPYTLQYGPCGTQGLRTVLPIPFVTAENRDALAEEWLRFRYGVFSTESFPNDPLYFDGVPSKQDALCGSSVEDVAFKSKDFMGANLAGQSEWQQPVFKILKEAPLRVVVVWDIVNVSRADNPEVKSTQNALKKYATRMAPKDSYAALICFGDDVLYCDGSLRANGESTPFAQSIPTKATNPKVSSTLTDALSKAKSLLEDKGQSALRGGTVLLITERSITPEDYTKAKEELQNTDIILHALMLPPYDGGDTLERLASEFGGKAVSIPVMDETLSLSYQADTIANILQRGSSSPNLVVLQTETENHLRARKDWELPIEPDLKEGTTLRVEIMTDDTETNRFLNGILLQSPNNAQQYTSRKCERVEFFMLPCKVENPPPGIWTLQIDEPSAKPLMIDVMIEPSDAEKIIKVNVWTSETSDSIDPSKQFMIYAEVRKGVQPIRGATVEATVMDPSGTEKKFELVDNGRGDPDITAGDGIYSRYFTGFSTKGHYTLSVSVKGTEHTEVVSTRSDEGLRCCGSEFPKEPSEPTGLFSRYFQYGTFVTLQDRPPGDIYPPSRVTDLTVKSIDSKNMAVTLEWTAPGNDFDSGAADKYEIRYFDKKVEFDKEFEKAGTLVGEFDIDGLTPFPKEYGQLETATLKKMNCNRKPATCYIALRADDARNHGPVSNVVPVQFDEVPITPSGGGGTSDGKGGKDGKDGTVDGKDATSIENKRGGAFLGLAIGIPIALIIVIIIIVIIVIWFMRTRKRSKEAPIQRRPPPPQQNNKGDDTTDQNENQYESPPFMSTSISPVNSYSADYLLERYEEEKKRKSNKTPTAPEKDDLQASSEESSVGKSRAHPIWWMPKGPQAPDNGNPLYEEPPAVYATVNKPSKDTSPKRMHTVV